MRACLTLCHGCGKTATIVMVFAAIKSGIASRTMWLSNPDAGAEQSVVSAGGKRYGVVRGGREKSQGRVKAGFYASLNPSIASFLSLQIFCAIVHSEDSTVDFAYTFFLSLCCSAKHLPSAKSQESTKKPPTISAPPCILFLPFWPCSYAFFSKFLHKTWYVIDS